MFMTKKAASFAKSLFDVGKAGKAVSKKWNDLWKGVGKDFNKLSSGLKKNTVLLMV